MDSLRGLQSAFAAALRDPALPAPGALSRAGEVTPIRRFNVHRNNVFISLAGVLEARFPAVRRLVGEEFFKAMARHFVDEMPPLSPVLLEYGATFPTILKAFAPVSSEPYLADVARLEWQLHEAFHAEDSRSLTPGDFSALRAASISRAISSGGSRAAPSWAACSRRTVGALALAASGLPLPARPSRASSCARQCPDPDDDRPGSPLL